MQKYCTKLVMQKEKIDIEYQQMSLMIRSCDIWIRHDFTRMAIIACMVRMRWGNTKLAIGLFLEKTSKDG